MCKAVHRFIWRVCKARADVFPYKPFSHLKAKPQDKPEYETSLKTYPMLPFAIVKMTCRSHSEHRGAFLVLPMLELGHPIVHCPHSWCGHWPNPWNFWNNHSAVCAPCLRVGIVVKQHERWYLYHVSALSIRHMGQEMTSKSKIANGSLSNPRVWPWRDSSRNLF